MAEVKAIVKATAKPAAKAVTTPKVEVAEVKKEAAPKKEIVKKAAAPKKAATQKKETVKKEAAPKKAAVKKVDKEVIRLEFDGKSYTNEYLVKIAKDVWQFDLAKSLDEIKTMELYVKPVEALVYYVINGDVSGSFAI